MATRTKRHIQGSLKQWISSPTDLEPGCHRGWLALTALGKQPSLLPPDCSGFWRFSVLLGSQLISAPVFACEPLCVPCPPYKDTSHWTQAHPHAVRLQRITSAKALFQTIVARRGSWRTWVLEDTAHPSTSVISRLERSPVWCVPSGPSQGPGPRTAGHVHVPCSPSLFLRSDR